MQRTIEELKKFIKCGHKEMFLVNEECIDCALKESMEGNAHIYEKFLEERNSRIIYQNIVYKICQIFDDVGIENKCSVEEVLGKVTSLKNGDSEFFWSENETSNSLSETISDLNKKGFMVIVIHPILNNLSTLKFFILAERKPNV